MADNSLKMGMAQRPLKGSEKAAALLLAMGKPMASKLLKHFDAADLKEITRSAADLGAVSAPALDEAIEEFATQFSTGADLHGTVGEVEQLLTGVVPPSSLLRSWLTFSAVRINRCGNDCRAYPKQLWRAI